MVERESILVTILICVYNGARFIGEALESALTQTHRNLEVIVFNDGSTDETGDRVRAFDDPRLHFVDSSVNRGLSIGRNVGKELAQGEFLAFLDADDLYLPTRVARLLEKALETDADLVGDTYRFMQDDGTLCDEYYRVPDEIAADPYLTRLFERNVMIPHPLIRRRCFKAIDFDPAFSVSQDYDFFLKASYHGFRFSFVPEVLLHYRKTSGSMSSSQSSSRQDTCDILSQYGADDLRELYRRRGLQGRHTNYMLTLHQLFQGRYREALAHTEGDWPRDSRADWDFYRGTLLLRTGRAQEALHHLEAHLERFPGSPAGLNNLGVCLAKLNRPAKPCFESAVVLFPGYEDAAGNQRSEPADRITNTQLPIVPIEEPIHAL